MQEGPFCSHSFSLPARFCPSSFPTQLFKAIFWKFPLFFYVSVFKCLAWDTLSLIWPGVDQLSIIAPYGVNGGMTVFSTFLSLVYSIFREMGKTASSRRSVLPLCFYTSLCTNTSWKFQIWALFQIVLLVFRAFIILLFEFLNFSSKKSGKWQLPFFLCFSFYIPLFFSTITCFLFTRKKIGRHTSVTIAPSSVPQRLWRLHSHVSMSPSVEKFGARAGSELTLHEFQCLNKSECMWGSMGVWKATKTSALIALISVSHLYIRLLLSSS